MKGDVARASTARRRPCEEEGRSGSPLPCFTVTSRRLRRFDGVVPAARGQCPRPGRFAAVPRGAMSGSQQGPSPFVPILNSTTTRLQRWALLRQLAEMDMVSRSEEVVKGCRIDESIYGRRWREGVRGTERDMPERKRLSGRRTGKNPPDNAERLHLNRQV